MHIIDTVHKLLPPFSYFPTVIAIYGELCKRGDLRRRKHAPVGLVSAYPSISWAEGFFVVGGHDKAEETERREV